VFVHLSGGFDAGFLPVFYFLTGNAGFLINLIAVFLSAMFGVGLSAQHTLQR
jgi:hypothetical protein